MRRLTALLALMLVASSPWSPLASGQESEVQGNFACALLERKLEGL